MLVYAGHNDTVEQHADDMHDDVERADRIAAILAEVDDEETERLPARDSVSVAEMVAVVKGARR